MNRPTHRSGRRTRACAWYLSVLAVVMTACSVSQPTPEDHYYRLPTPRVAKPAHRPFIGHAVEVSPLAARGLYQERAILYSDTHSPLELHLYNYHFWTESPSRIIQEHLVEYLRAAGIAKQVARTESAGPAPAVVRGRIERFERLVGGARDRVTVELDLRYDGAGPPADATVDRTYTATVPVQGRNMEAVITAFGTALDQACGEFVRDLREATGKGGR